MRTTRLTQALTAPAASPQTPTFLFRALRSLRRRSLSLLRTAESVSGRFHCNVCDRRVGRFLPLSAVHPATVTNKETHGFRYELETFNQSHYSCPFCGATDRDRLYALYLEECLSRLGVDRPIQIVDFAPVRCLSRYIRTRLEHHPSSMYRTADLYNPEVDDQVDLMDLRVYRDGQFDVFICSHVLEHVADDRRAMRELYRVTAPGGTGIVMVPIPIGVDTIDEDPGLTDESERWRRFGQNDHVRLYSRTGFIMRLREAGFEVSLLSAMHFGSDRLDQLAILHESLLYLAHRPN